MPLNPVLSNPPSLSFTPFHGLPQHPKANLQPRSSLSTYSEDLLSKSHRVLKATERGNSLTCSHVYFLQEELSEGSRNIPALSMLKILLAQESNREKSYHGIIAIAGQNDDVDWRGVIGHADATVSGPVFSVFRKNAKAIKSMWNNWSGTQPLLHPPHGLRELRRALTGEVQVSRGWPVPVPHVTQGALTCRGR